MFMRLVVDPSAAGIDGAYGRVDPRGLVVPSSRGGSRFILLADMVVLLQVIIYAGIPQAPCRASGFFSVLFFVFSRVFVWGSARAEGGGGCCMSDGDLRVPCKSLPNSTGMSRNASGGYGIRQCVQGSTAYNITYMRTW